MDSKFLLAEVQACCSSLGYLDNGVYHRGEDHLNAIKDLIRYLRRDGETCQIRRILGDARVVQNDLVPMLKQYKEDDILFDLLIRLLVNLTQPAALCFNNKPPEDKELRMYYLQITAHLQSYQQFFANETSFFAVVTKKLVALFNRDWEEREEEERLLAERLLVLVRNVVSIPSDPDAEKRTENDVSVHDLLYWAMQSAGLESVFLYISSTSTEAQFCLLTLEIINHVMREQSPSELASAGQTRSEKEQENDSHELEAIRLREAAIKKMNTMKYSGRHSHFGGTFTLANIKGIAENDAIVHKPLNKIKEKISFDEDKKRRRRAKNKLPPADPDAARKSTQTIRVVFRDFCVKFLDHCYNPIMRAIRDAIRHKKGEENDETFYFWAIRFFMEFNRLYHFDVGLVSETLSMTVFYSIQVHLTDCYERMVMEKRQKHDSLAWGRRLHLALKAYQELLLTVHAMGKSKDPVLINNSTILKNNLFYVMEYRDLFVMLLKKFDETRLSKSFLRDLFETAHVFIKMLEDHCKSNAHTMVQKTTVKKKKKKKPQKSKESPLSSLSPNELEIKWDKMAPQLSRFLTGTDAIPDDVIPFDAASSVLVDDQKAQAMIRIQDTLREDNAGEAVALLRAARSVWSEGDVFGAESISPEEELDALRQVMMADLPRIVESRADERPAEEDEEDEEDEEEESQQMVPVEVEFKFNDYLVKFARGEVVKNCSLLLNDYATNSAAVNHAVVKLLHRLCVDMKAAGLTHQVAMLRNFQKILHDPGAKAKHMVELYGFAKYMTRKFFEDLGQNPLLVVEALFWKDLKEAIDVSEGYGSFKEKNKAAKTLWTEDQEAEIRLLWEEHKHRREAGEDVADVILDALSDPGEKTRTQLVRQMVRMDLLGSAKDLKVSKRREPRTPKHVWPEELEDELKGLFQKHSGREAAERGVEGEDGDETPAAQKESSDESLDAIDKVMRDLSDGSRSRKDVLIKLASMDLIQDPNVYRKKGARHVVYWREEQVSELKSLWETYEDAQSPLDRIKESIAAKRSKSAIADKLLDLGLIGDKKALLAKGKKEVKGKRAGGEGGKRRNDEASDEEEVITPPTTDDENARQEYEERKKILKTKSARDSAHAKRRDEGKKKKRKKKEPVASSTQSSLTNILPLVKDLQGRGLEEPLKWLRGMMQMRADDLQDGDDEDEDGGGFALVPLTEENEEAMSDAGFLRLLRGFGFSEPIVGQEAFWRIPASFDHRELYGLATQIDGGLSGEGETAENVVEAGIISGRVSASGSSSSSSSGSNSGSNSGSDSDSDRNDGKSSQRKPSRSVRSTSSLSSRAASIRSSSQRSGPAKVVNDEDDEDDDLDKFLTANKIRVGEASTENVIDADESEASKDNEDGDRSNESKTDRWKMLREMAKTRRAENKRGEKNNRQKRQLNKEKKFALRELEESVAEEASPDITEEGGARKEATPSPVPSGNDATGRLSASPSDSGSEAGFKMVRRPKKKTAAAAVASLEAEEVASPAIDSTQAVKAARKRRVLEVSDDSDVDDVPEKSQTQRGRKRSRLAFEEEEAEENEKENHESGPTSKRRAAIIDSDSN